MAFEEERQRGAVVLFPVRLDNAVFAAKEAGPPSGAAATCVAAPAAALGSATRSSQSLVACQLREALIRRRWRRLLAPFLGAGIFVFRG